MASCAKVSWLDNKLRPRDSARVSLTMKMEDITFTLMMVGIPVVLIAALVGFILVQIKARLAWRLLSMAVVLIVCCWLSCFFTHLALQEKYITTYERGVRDFVQATDQMALQGRTSDVHQSCQKFLDVFFLWTDQRALTNFDQFVQDTCVLANDPAKTRSEPNPAKGNTS
jgi:hypothetical protein